MINLRHRLSRAIEKNYADIFGLGLRKYPPFTWNNDIAHLDEIPVFVFHQVTAATLEPLFRYLAENGYQTVTADEYVTSRERVSAYKQRAVLLTFDDGHQSLYNVAFPLLKRFAFHAVAYVVPGQTPEANDSAPVADPAYALCTWQQLAEMHNSGVVDIQSHSMYHHSIATTDRVVDFMRPGLEPSFLTSDLSPLHVDQSGHFKLGRLPYGMPLYGWGARYGKQRAYCECPRVRQICIDFVAAHGGTAFFDDPHWHTKLIAIRNQAARLASSSGWEDGVDQRQAILADLHSSKRLLEERLSQKIVRHFCFPWFRGSAIGAALSAEAGYCSNAWGGLLPRFTQRQRQIVAIPRLAPAFIYRLPGQARRPLWQILLHKVTHERVRPRT